MRAQSPAPASFDAMGRAWTIEQERFASSPNKAWFFVVYCNGATIADYRTLAGALARVKRECEGEASDLSGLS